MGIEFQQSELETPGLSWENSATAEMALQKVGIKPFSSAVVIQVAADGSPGPTDPSHRSAAPARPAEVSEAKVKVDLQHDADASHVASTQAPQDQENEEKLALSILSISDKGIDDEGKHLLGTKQPR